MKRLVASFCIWWAAACAAAPPPNTLPLAFGMTPDEASAALGVPLVRHSGGRGSEILIARYPARMSGYYPVDEGIALQFRNRRLTGWKLDWKVGPDWHAAWHGFAR